MEPMGSNAAGTSILKGKLQKAALKHSLGLFVRICLFHDEFPCRHRVDCTRLKSALHRHAGWDAYNKR